MGLFLVSNSSSFQFEDTEMEIHFKLSEDKVTDNFLLVDLTMFLETPRDELYFSSLSSLLNSKLKPENIRLIVLGGFLAFE